MKCLRVVAVVAVVAAPPVVLLDEVAWRARDELKGEVGVKSSSGERQLCSHAASRKQLEHCRSMALLHLSIALQPPHLHTPHPLSLSISICSFSSPPIKCRNFKWLSLVITGHYSSVLLLSGQRVTKCFLLTPTYLL